MNNPSTYEYLDTPRTLPLSDLSSCTRCSGQGEVYYVYCSACGVYVDGHYGTLSPLEELRGMRRPIFLDCGHEAYSLPGIVACPDCGSSRFAGSID